MSAVTYDAGALIALDRGEVTITAVHRRLQERGVVPVVPAGVLAQVWRDPAHQVRLGFALRGCRVEPLDQDVARRVGELARATGASDVVDLSVAVGVLGRGGIVYSSDPDDLAACGIPKAAIQRA